LVEERELWRGGLKDGKKKRLKTGASFKRTSQKKRNTGGEKGADLKDKDVTEQGKPWEKKKRG